MVKFLPITEIFLKGSFEEMGEQYMNKLGPIVSEQIKLVDEEFGADFFEKFKPFMPIFFKKYPKEFQEMYNAMAQSEYAKTQNISLERLTFLDTLILCTLQHPGVISPEIVEEVFDKQIHDFPEIADFLKENREKYRAKMAVPAVDHCSTIGISQVSSKTDKQELATGRSFDWPKKAMRAATSMPIVLHLECTDPAYKNPLTIISHPGSVSGFTFSTPKAMWEINSAAHAMLTAGEMRMDRNYSVSTAMLHLMAAENYNDALTLISNMVTDYPSIIALTGKTIEEAAIIEMYPGDIRNKESETFKNIVHRLGDENVDPEYAITDKGFARSNLVHGKGWDETLGHHHVEDTALQGADVRENNLIALMKNLALRLSSATKTAKAHLESDLYAEKNPGATKYYDNDNELAATYYQTVHCLGKGKKSDGTIAPDMRLRVQQVEKGGASSYTPWHKFCTMPSESQSERVAQAEENLNANIAKIRNVM